MRAGYGGRRSTRARAQIEGRARRAQARGSTRCDSRPRVGRRAWASVLSPDGEREREGRARLGARAHVERAAMRLCDRAGDEETEPRAGLGCARHVHPAELLEDATLLVAGDARACVTHRDAHRAVRRRRRDAHLPALRRVLDGVLDQVAEYLTDPGTVPANRLQPAADGSDDRHVLLREGRSLDCLVDDAAEVELLEAVAERP